MSRRASQAGERGQGLVEFALVLPIFLAMVFGMIDLGRVIWANDTLANAAREGARFASVTGTSLITPTSTKDEIRAKTREYLFGAATSVNVAVCYYAMGETPCTGNTDGPGATASRGSMVRVTITGVVPVLTGSLIGIGDYTLQTTSAVIMNN